MSRLEYVNNEIVSGVKPGKYGVSIATKYIFTQMERDSLIQNIIRKDETIRQLRQEIQIVELREYLLMEEIVKRGSLRTDAAIVMPKDTRIGL